LPLQSLGLTNTSVASMNLLDGNVMISNIPHFKSPAKP
jgi:hypothetical protein